VEQPHVGAHAHREQQGGLAREQRIHGSRWVDRPNRRVD
jgi:hypothetical protein